MSTANLGQRRALSPPAEALLALLAVSFLALVPYRDFFSSRVPIGRDLLFYFYPLKAHLAEAWRAGQIPWIDRYRWGGAPLLGAPGSAPFYPGNLLFVLLPLGTGMKSWALVHLVVGIAGFAAFSRRLGLSAGASAVAGLVFGLSGVSVSLVPFPSTFSALALLPWFAVAAVDVRRGPSRQRIVSLAAVAGLLLLASIPELVLYAALVGVACLGPYVLRGGEERRRFRSALAGAAAAGLLALALGSAAVVPAAATASRSVRQGALNVKYAGKGSLPPARLKELLLDGLVADWTLAPGVSGVPYPYLPSITPGRVALLLALLGLAAGGEGRSRAVGLAALGILLALGPATPVWRSAARLVPLLSGVRYPEKHMILTGFALAWLAALGLGALESRLRPKAARVVLPLLALGVLLDRASIARGLSPMGPAELLTTPPPILAPLQPAAPHQPPPRLFHADSFAPPPVGGRLDVVTETRVETRFLMPDYASLFGVAHPFERDYDLSLPPETQAWALFFRAALPTGSPVPLLIARGAGAAAWEASERREDGSYVARLRLFPNPVAPYRFARRLAIDGDSSRLFRRVLDERFDPGTAYLPGLAKPWPEALSRGEVREVSDRADRLRLSVRVEGPADGFLMLFRLWDAARDATLDGHPVPLVPMAFGFGGLRVPPGEHRLELRPDTRWVKIGVGMTLTAIAMLSMLCRRGRVTA